MSIDRHTRGLLKRAQEQAERAAENIGEVLEAGEFGSAFDFATDRLADAQSDLTQARAES